MTMVHNLTPSPLRTVTLQGCGGLQIAAMWCPKASADCLDYILDFSALLAGTGDTLSSVTSEAVTTAQGSSYDLTIMWSAVAGTQVVVFLASGQPGSAQRILFEVATAQGRVYSVMAVIQITTLTAATAPPSDFPVDTLTNGKVLIAGVEALPSGYSSNGRVVMATADEAPVGTPSFESVASESYSGDGSGLNVTSGTKTQTVAEWVASLSGGTNGAGIKSIEATQGAVTAGQPSTVTLTATLTDGTTSQTTFEAPAGAAGAKGDMGAPGPAGSDADVTPASIETALGYTPADVADTLSLANGGSVRGSLTLQGNGANLVFKDDGGAYVSGQWSYNKLAFGGGDNPEFLWPGGIGPGAYTFDSLPSPDTWVMVFVTDKSINGGAQGVMAMWNPNTKVWTGLSGETLT